MPSTPFRHWIDLLRARPYLLALCCMVASTAAFSAMNVCIREASGELHTTVIVCLRNALSLAILLPLALRHGVGMLHTKRLGSHFWRATVGSIGMQCWFYSVATLPLNHATALSFTAPLFTSLFAVLILKENASPARWAALLAGFLGTLVILRPDPQDFELNSLVVMFTTSIWAVAGMLVKSLTRTEPPIRIITYMAFFMFLWSLPLAIPHWTMPSTKAWGLMVLIALFSSMAHGALVKAYSLANVVELMPFDFLRLIFTAIFAYVVFHETSDPYTWLGAAIIIGSAVYIARRDAKAAPIV